jgi:hypothetical protein
VKDFALNARAVASSTHQVYTADKAVDGVVSNESRWISAAKPGPHTLTIELAAKAPIGCLQLVSGWCPEGAWIHPVASFRFEARSEGQWKAVPGAAAAGNRRHAWECRLKEPVTADAIRLVALDDGYVRVAAVRAFAFDAKGMYPPVAPPIEPDVRHGTLCISGIYPHLAAFSHGGECGIGAVVPWANRLWYLTYPPHAPQGSSDKLYEIAPDMTMTVRPESVGGTHANRLIHRESNQLIMGPYFIDAKRQVRAADLQALHGRMTATARHLSDPANKVYFFDMEGPLYEVNVHSLAVTKLSHKPVPGWHGKGGYTGQGRLVITNNGENPVGGYGLENLEAGGPAKDPEDAGVLAEWDGKNWGIVERRQFTDVTGPGGIHGAPDDTAPVWAMGWDRRSVMLKVLADGEWSTYRLPKGSYTFDPRHGWYTEWPRIREVAPDRFLMVMHGTMFDFPKQFGPGQTGGLRPIATHLRYIPDFCGWQDKLVLAADDTSIMQNPLAGQSQSNLWFGSLADLDEFGPKIGFGGVWVDDDVKANTPSDPLLVAGYGSLTLHLQNHYSNAEVVVTVEGDAAGPGNWHTESIVRLSPGDYAPIVLSHEGLGTWLRVRTDVDARMTAYAHLGAPAARTDDSAFAALATGTDRSIALLRPAKHNKNLQVLARTTDSASWKYLEVDEKLAFTAVEDAARASEMERIAAIQPFAKRDELSPYLVRKGVRYRLPAVQADTGPARDLREVQSERYLLNVGGLFYEMPRDDGIPRLRPVCAHHRQIYDFCTWRGLLVLSGCRTDAKPDGQFFAGPDGTGLWFGAVDDLWRLGKPVGSGYVWRDTTLAAGDVSDPFLATGFNQKTVVVSHDSPAPQSFVLEGDFLSTGSWQKVVTITLPPNHRIEHRLPAGLATHWLRLRATETCTATAQFIYE